MDPREEEKEWPRRAVGTLRNFQEKRKIMWEAEFECLMPGRKMRFYCLINGSNESYSWFVNRRS